MKKIDGRIVKALLAAVSLGYTIYLFVGGHWVSGIFMLLLSALLGFLVTRSVRLIMVFLQIRQQKMDKAKVWLERIDPEKLWKNQKGYYWFLLGSIDIQKNSLSQSEKYFRNALHHGLRMDHDKAMVYLNLAVIAANKRKKREAMTLLNDAKKLDTKGYLKKDIKEVSKLVNSI
jgi:tetratricopeptide (TPR) repeat protein